MSHSNQSLENYFWKCHCWNYNKNIAVTGNHWKFLSASPSRVPCSLVLSVHRCLAHKTVKQLWVGSCYEFTGRNQHQNNKNKCTQTAHRPDVFFPLMILSGRLGRCWCWCVSRYLWRSWRAPHTLRYDRLLCEEYGMVLSMITRMWYSCCGSCWVWETNILALYLEEQQT